MEGEDLNRKNITGEIIGFDLDAMIDDEPGTSPGNVPDEPEEETENALISLIDIGLDMADGVCKDMGYPAESRPNRDIWERHGKTALNRALNVYFPPGSAAGGALDSPAVSLIIGLGALGICLYPAIAYTIKQRKDAAGTPAEEIAEPATSAPEFHNSYEIPETGYTSTAPISNMDVRPIDRIMAASAGRPDSLPGF